MPGGSEYPGPAKSLQLYTDLVASSSGNVTVKGAKNPYTSRNGHMYSFLDKDGGLALRLPDDAADEFLETYESGPVIAYGSVMRGYVSVPADLLELTAELRPWFERAYEWIGTLPPK